MSIEKTSFKTRARTIDHLGREQIADCPTAISELWKNSYDAYARSVELNIFDPLTPTDLPVATLVDDGHGMSKEEIIEKWLVVGTDSKVTGYDSVLEDRNGLPIRPRQGQKGIGRLSSAAMGNLLLLVSKSKTEPFAAVLIDWRIFENPYLILNDIQIPVVEFEQKTELFTYLPQMFDELMSNIWGLSKENKVESEIERDNRIINAWKLYDDLELNTGKSTTTKSDIENTIIASSFEETHLESWSVWKGDTAHGTGLFISKISEDLLAVLSRESFNNTESLNAITKAKLFETLSGFIDPYVREGEISAGQDFTASVTAWHSGLQRVIIDKYANFNINNLDRLEHSVEGEVDENGVFWGKIRVFGREFHNIEVKPKEPVQKTPGSTVGKFYLRIGTYEINIGNTTHTREQNNYLEEAAALYSGFRMYRDGFRVMPYGREENDYFQIEKRRSMNAGDYFWASRRTFGGLKISRENNPNLRDKAGREGLIDNRAAKQFREIVINLLKELGRKHFGRHSDNRLDILPQVQADHAKTKAEGDKKKLITVQRRIIRNAIKENTQRLNEISESIFSVRNEMADGKLLVNFEEVLELQVAVSDLVGQIKDLEIGFVPTNLGSVESDYKTYSQKIRKSVSALNEISSSINIALTKFQPPLPGKLILDDLNRKQALLVKRIKKWNLEGLSELHTEIDRFSELAKVRSKSFPLEVEKLPEQVDSGEVDLENAFNLLETAYQSHARENESIFPPYIRALQSLRDQIDLQGLATFSMGESDELRDDIARIHSLAQLGITVEIIGHEIEGLDLTIERGLAKMSPEVKSSRDYQSVLTAHHSLSDKWRFLSPLKLSGEKIYSDITGKEMHQYILDFFGDFLDSDIQLSVTDEFLNFSVNDLAARLYPVFVNLINNARYWVRHQKSESKEIKLDFIDGKVIIADNGPGVEDEDVTDLFTLFFSRKTSGGRGVGLYLCRANLAAGGHSIYYEIDKTKKILTGANFVIEFKGVRNGVNDNY